MIISGEGTGQLRLGVNGNPEVTKNLCQDKRLVKRLDRRTGAALLCWHPPSKLMICRLFCLVFPFIAIAASAAEGRVFTEVLEATQKDPDFALQGEYSGELDGKKTGVQLVAEGAGTFSAVLYPGGLPGDGFAGDRNLRIKGQASQGKVTFPGLAGTLAGGKLIFPKGTLSRIERHSPAWGAAAPAGGIVLFDGTSAGAFENGRLDGGTLMQGITSKEKWGSFTLHVEFTIPYMPEHRGQGRGNSGCYLQGRYEVQVLDSFGLEGKDNECGGIYTIAPPLVNMAFPPLAWQTYDIDYTAAVYDAAGRKTSSAKATVKHNGVLVQDAVELTHATTSAPLPEGPEPGPLHFQDHGAPVRYRNIWIVRK